MTIGTAMQSYHSDRKSEGGEGGWGGGWRFTSSFNYSMFSFSTMKMREMQSQAIQIFYNFLGGV